MAARGCLRTAVGQNEELALLLSSFLAVHDLHVLSSTGSSASLPAFRLPRFRQALALRGLLSLRFATLEVAILLLRFWNRPRAHLSEVYSGVSLLVGGEFGAQELGQLTALADGMIAVVAGATLTPELAVEQRAGHGEVTLNDLPARRAHLDAVLAERTEQLACGRLPCLTWHRVVPRGRRLSRQASGCPPLARSADLAEYNRTMLELAELARWREAVRDAEVTRATLQKLFATPTGLSRPIPEEAILKILTSRCSKKRCGNAVGSKHGARIALALLSAWAPDWLCKSTSGWSQAHGCSASVAANAAAAVERAQGRLRERTEALERRVMQAFVATIPAQASGQAADAAAET